MKLADIVPEGVYAYGKSNTPYHTTPYVVLSTERYMHVDRDSRWTKAHKDDKMGTGRRYPYRTVGLPAVHLYFTDEDPQYLTKLARVLEVATVEGAKSGAEVRDGDAVLGTYRLITSSRYLHGDYIAWYREKRQRDRDREEHADRVEKSRLSRLARYRALNARLEALGFKDGQYVGDYSDVHSFKIGLDTMERLLSLAESAVRANKAAGIGG
jgi:hypothetical protein